MDAEPGSIAAGGSAGRRTRAAAILVAAAFAVVFLGLRIHALRQDSPTFDEPLHLAAGYAALAHRDYRVDPSHPPFLRMWAALPLLADPPAAPAPKIDNYAPELWLQHSLEYSRAFLFADRAADRRLDAARMMVAFWGLVLGLLIYAWAREWLGAGAAFGALILFVAEPNLSAHASLVTTDEGQACFVFAAVYCLWRWRRSNRRTDFAATAAFAALAIVTKFSGIVILPILAALLLTDQRMRARDVLRSLLLIALIVYAAIWAVYGFRFAPGPTPDWRFSLEHYAAPGAFGHLVAAVARWLDAHHLLPNAYTEGFVFSIGSARMLPSYLFGHYSTDGWWYYFLVVLVLKTPASLLALALAGAVYAIRRRAGDTTRTIVYLVVPVAIFLAAAAMSRINLGVRHVLPVYPFLVLLAAAALRAMATAPRRAIRLLAPVPVAAAIIEFALVYPHTLAHFSILAGGSTHGRTLLTESNLDWGQDLKRLKTWMDAHTVRHINLAYFGSADPKYYGIECTHLPGAPLFAIPAVRRPDLPGYVAISATVLSGVYLPPRWRLHYEPFQRMHPVAVIGGSVFVYYVDRWPETPRLAESRTVGTRDPVVLRRLADSLVAQKWHDRAARIYRRYLRFRPGDAEALGNLGVALMGAGAKQEALDAFRAAVAAAPATVRARKNFALALLDAERLPDARRQAERALALAPDDPGARDLLNMIGERQTAAAPPHPPAAGSKPTGLPAGGESPPSRHEATQALSG